MQAHTHTHTHTHKVLIHFKLQKIKDKERILNEDREKILYLEE